MTELPEGPLTDQNGKKWDIAPATRVLTWDLTIPIPPFETFFIKPHVERLPLFTDLAGNPVFVEDQKAYFYDFSTKEIQEQRINKEWGQYNPIGDDSPLFKHRSDCERWVASNVKTMTMKEAYELMKKVYLDYLRDGGDYSSFGEWCEDPTVNKCL